MRCSQKRVAQATNHREKLPKLVIEFFMSTLWWAAEYHAREPAGSNPDPSLWFPYGNDWGSNFRASYFFLRG